MEPCENEILFSVRVSRALGLPAYWIHEELYGWSLFVADGDDMKRLCSYGFDADEGELDDLAMRDIELLHYLLRVRVIGASGIS